MLVLSPQAVTYLFVAQQFLALHAFLLQYLKIGTGQHDLILEFAALPDRHIKGIVPMRIFCELVFTCEYVFFCFLYDKAVQDFATQVIDVSVDYSDRLIMPFFYL